MRIGARFPQANAGGDMPNKPPALVAAEDQYEAALRAYEKAPKSKKQAAKVAYQEAAAKLHAERAKTRSN
jgi:hypothetical protein